MYTPNLVSILFYDQPLSIFKFDDVMPTSRIDKADQNMKNGLVLMSRQENLPIYSWYSLYLLPYFKHDQSVSPLGTFSSILLNCYHGNDDWYKNFDFSFCYVFPRCMPVQSFITIKWQGKKLSVIKSFIFLVSDHLKGSHPYPLTVCLASNECKGGCQRHGS